MYAEKDMALYDYFSAHDEDEYDSVPPDKEGEKKHNFYYTAPNWRYK